MILAARLMVGGSGGGITMVFLSGFSQ